MTTDDQIPLDPPADLSADLDKAQRQIADYKALIADFDNSRKRLLQDAERERKYAAERLVRDILPGLDNLDRALTAAAAANEAGPLVGGVKATVSLLLDVLKRHGVARMDVPAGAAFDPNLHEAVSQLPAAEGQEPGTVAQVLQHGFTLHDRVLRPAGVVVVAE